MLTEQEKQELREQYNPEGSPIRNFQMELLQLMVEFEDYAKAHNVHYSMAYGTLLGAIRHQGFIPWDDDVDYVMTREEWEHLNTLIPEDGFLTENVYIARAQGPYIKNRAGRIIDLMIMDDSPSSPIKKWIKQKTAELIKVILKCKRRIQCHDYKRFKPWFVLMPFAFLFSEMQLTVWLDKVSQWWNERSETNPQKQQSFNDALSCIKNVFDAGTSKEKIYVDFEGVQLPIMSDYDAYLKVCYGNYWEIPQMKRTHGRF